MIVFRVVTLPVKVGTKTGMVATKVGYRTARFVGFKRIALIAIGVGIGLLVAPVPGRQLREKLRAALGGAGGEAELGDLVRFELSHSPKTWHLPQPAIAVHESTVVLSGAVPHETARADLERAASGVPGVESVENLLVVSGTNGHS
jgi:hypothetical protein